MAGSGVERARFFVEAVLQSALGADSVNSSNKPEARSWRCVAMQFLHILRGRFIG
jgi:hypothetical protein